VIADTLLVRSDGTIPPNASVIVGYLGPQVILEQQVLSRDVALHQRGCHTTACMAVERCEILEINSEMYHESFQREQYSFLKEVSFLCESSDWMLNQLASMMSIQNFEVSETLVARGDPVQSKYFIVKGGQLKVTISLQDAFTMLGEPVPALAAAKLAAMVELCLLGEGDIVDDCLLKYPGGHEYDANVVAATSVQVYALTKDQFEWSIDKLKYNRFKRNQILQRREHLRRVIDLNQSQVKTARQAHELEIQMREFEAELKQQPLPEQRAQFGSFGHDSSEAHTGEAPQPVPSPPPGARKSPDSTQRARLSLMVPATSRADKVKQSFVDRKSGAQTSRRAQSFYGIGAYADVPAVPAPPAQKVVEVDELKPSEFHSLLLEQSMLRRQEQRMKNDSTAVLKSLMHAQQPAAIEKPNKPNKPKKPRVSMKQWESPLEQRQRMDSLPALEHRRHRSLLIAKAARDSKLQRSCGSFIDNYKLHRAPRWQTESV